METEPKVLSASKIKTFENCSWLYWGNYHLKLPQKSNEGAQRGTICHLIFEILLNPKHKLHFKKIKKAETITSSPPIRRLVIKHLKKMQINTDKNFKLIDEMILVGINNDFFIRGAILLDPEYEFNLTNETPKYSLTGFIDKAAENTKNGTFIITDYKSSKFKFDENDLESNIQAMIYSLVAKKIKPELTPIVKFIFLRYGKDPIQTVQFNDVTLKGFEHYLQKINETLNNFSEEQAVQNFAADKKPKGGGFNGSLLCGLAKSPNEKKKDGQPMWACPYKFSFKYFILKDKNGKILKSDFNNSFTPKEEETVEELTYQGCPRHKATSPEF
jgi:ATP-dependent helicase/DNAse subunit B